jgi:hypothetical protein
MNLDWIIDGTTYSLDDRQYFYLLDYSGFGLVPLHRLSERGPLQHGDTDRGYRLDPRIAMIKLAIKGTSEQDYIDKRNKLYQIFGPGDDAGVLQYSYFAPSVYSTIQRRLDCYCLEVAPGEKNYRYQEFIVSLKANDPTWYRPEMVVENYTIPGGSDTMLVPTEIPMTLGASSISYNTIVANHGEVETFPIIKIIGPITGPKIVNNTTGDTLDFAGTTVSAGDYLQIDCRYGHKTVVDQDGTNQISTLSDDSDIATFSFIAEQGYGSSYKANSVTVTGTSATNATRIEIRFYRRYLGV